MTLVDTNVLLRWLLNDHPKLTASASSIVELAPAGSLLLTDIVVSEIVHVLRGKGYSYIQITEALLLLNRTPSIKFENEELILTIIGLLDSLKLDFADCYLLVRSRREHLQLATFDKKLRRAADV